ncbi:MAG: DUF928 domain-containing protein [Merismopedia sp. SIO2A8]|nr:DUF928 domain-containing protein [Merismopedia sp. SIO2A8]
MINPISSSSAQTSYYHQSDDIDDVVAHIATANFMPKREGVPERTAGGGSRNGSHWCSNSSHNAGVSLVPLVATEAQSLTTAEYPSFLVHISNRSVDQLLLSIKDHQGTYDYQTFVPISEDSGVLKISLPRDAPPLEVGRSYQWGVAILCGEALQPDDPFIQGYVQRIQGPDLAQKST